MRNTKKPIQLYRGTTQQHSDYAGPVGEITVDTEKYTVVVQNGVTGGVPLAREDTVVFLTNRIAAEESARATADTAIQKSVTDEVSARKAADTTLQNNIDNEASARETADTAIQKSVTDEVSARKAADTTLQNNIDSKTVHLDGTETITGTKTFTEKLFLTPKEDDRWAETYIHGTENTAKLEIQNKNIDAITDPLGYPPRSSLTLETIDNAGQGRFSLFAQSKYNTTNQRYYQYSLTGTSNGSLTWTGGGNPSLGHIEIVDSSSLSSSIGYIRYSSGLQICYGHVNCANYGYKSKYSQFTFPVAFKDTAYQVILCPVSNSMDIVANIKTGRTTTYCNIGVRNLSQTSSNWSADVLIHAIGYWK